MVIAWLYSVSMINKDIVYEKEMRLKEVMRIMGLSNAVHWTAWFISAFVVMVTSVILLCIIFKVSMSVSGLAQCFLDMKHVLLFLLHYLCNPSPLFHSIP